MQTPLFSPLPTPAELLANRAGYPTYFPGAAPAFPPMNTPVAALALQPLAQYSQPYYPLQTHLSVPSPVEVLATSGRLTAQNQPALPVNSTLDQASQAFLSQKPAGLPLALAPSLPTHPFTDISTSSAGERLSPSKNWPTPAAHASSLPALAEIPDTRSPLERYPELSDGINASRSIRPAMVSLPTPETSAVSSDSVPEQRQKPAGTLRAPESVLISPQGEATSPDAADNQPGTKIPLVEASAILPPDLVSDPQTAQPSGDMEDSRVTPPGNTPSQNTASKKPLVEVKANVPALHLKTGPVGRAQHAVAKTVQGGLLGAGIGLGLGTLASGLTFLKLRRVPAVFKAPAVRYRWLKGVLDRTVENLNASPMRTQLFAWGKRLMLLVPPSVGGVAGTIGGGAAGALGAMLEPRKPKPASPLLNS